MAEAEQLEAQGDVEEAVVVYEEVLQENPDDVEALSRAAVDLAFMGRFNDALPLQERMVAPGATDVQTRVELGFNYLNHQERPNDAVRVFGEAAELEPSAKNLTFLAQAQDLVRAQRGSGGDSPTGHKGGWDLRARVSRSWWPCLKGKGEGMRGRRGRAGAAQGIVIGESGVATPTKLVPGKGVQEVVEGCREYRRR